MKDLVDQLNALSTRAVRGELRSDPTTGSVLVPIYQTATYEMAALGAVQAHTYSRTSNPTVSALETTLGSIEGTPPAICFATGMAAITALCAALLEQGTHVVVSDVVYGGTVRLLDAVLARFGVTASYVDGSNPDNIGDAIRPETRFVLIETPANPTLKLTDIEAAARIARAKGVLLVVDNTFLTPALQQPLALGADVSLYSTTKYIEGHNSTVGGSIATRNVRVAEQLRFVRNALGLIQSPFDAWLTLRGIKTLVPRMRQHSASAQMIAERLAANPNVTQVIYPGLKSFAQYPLACRQQGSGGGLIAFELAGGNDSARAFFRALKLCTLAESLGAAETLVTHPGTMTHKEIAAADRKRLGISDGFVRLSVGLESPADILADLEQALCSAADPKSTERGTHPDHVS